MNLVSQLREPFESIDFINVFIFCNGIFNGFNKLFLYFTYFFNLKHVFL